MAGVRASYDIRKTDQARVSERADEATMTPNWRRVWLYYGATFVVTHVLSVGYVLSGGSWGSPRSFAIANALMLCPGAVAVTLQRFVLRQPLLGLLGAKVRPNAWFLRAWLFPPLVMVFALALSLFVPGARYAPDMGGLPPEMAPFRQQVVAIGISPIVTMLLIGLAFGPTLNAIGGLGEEIGWRGFLYAELHSLGFWKCSLVTGGLWAAWHVPLFFEGYGDRQYALASGVGFTAFAILLSPILHLVRSRSGSVVACAILHGTMSSTRLITAAFVRDAGPWVHASVPIALLAANAVVFVRHQPPTATRLPLPG